MAEKIISGAFKRCDMQGVVKRVTTWSEVCGTGFYKVVWSNNGGNVIGRIEEEDVYEGDVELTAVSPFEIFPDSLYVEELKDCASIIHAKAVSVKDIREKYGVLVEGNKVGIFDLAKSDGAYEKKNQEKVMKDASIVIERYERPCEEFPQRKA